MRNLYDKNGLIFWSEEEIKLREMFEDYFKQELLTSLKKQNSAFSIIKCEAPLITPLDKINKNYTSNDIYILNDEFALRPETTMGSFLYAKEIMSGYNDIKYKPPIVVYQHGKSFRQEQDQPTKFMRLKEFYQLEFQIIFSPKTGNDYSLTLYPDMQRAMSDMIGECKIEKSDRLPDYSEETMDIVCIKTEMEVCSMSKRKDLEDYKVIEIAIGTDRCIYNFLNK